MIERKWFLLYSIPVFVALIIFQNHYARDTVGALEKQLESDIPITPEQYSTLNSLFFFPNIVAPLLVGFFCEYFGGPAQFLVYAVILSSFGNLLFALGAQLKYIPLVYFGRFISGCVYEVIDTIPINFLAPFFKNEWGVIAGLMNCFLRLGSVFTFLLNPVIYEYEGVTAALWVSGCVVLSGSFATCSIIRNQKAYKAMCDSEENADGSQKDVTAMDNTSNSTEVENPLVANTDQGVLKDTKIIELPPENLTITQQIARYLPLHLYGAQFHFFNLAAMCLYGSMVPFWFIGSKFMQINYNMTVGKADSLMLLPEGTMVVLSPLLGFFLDKVKWSVRIKLTVLCLACISLTISYFMLTSGYHCSVQQSSSRHCHVTISPIASMLLLGISYAVCNSMLSTSIIFVIEEKYLASASGFVASCMNILPSLLPVVIVWLEQQQSQPAGGAGSSNVGMYVLSVSAVCAAVCALCSAMSKPVASEETQVPAVVDSEGVELTLEKSFRTKININEYTAVGTNEEGDDPA